MGRIWVILRKIFSVSLVFNALLTIGSLVGILSGYYWYFHDWEPFTPYLLSGHILWIGIVASIINIFPSAAIGRSLHTGRFLFHHYLYGFIVLACAMLYVVIFVPVSLLNLFFVDNTSVAVNFGRFFILGGLALVIDDLPDVSTHIENALNHLKFLTGEKGRIVTIIHLVCGAFSLYIFVAIALSMYYKAEWVTLANFIVAISMFITGITSFIFVRRNVWMKINHKNAH
jgi:hypothetical protein